MPLYEYKCELCGEKEERLEKFDAPTSHNCIFCNAPSGMSRQLSLTSFVLAGSGWMAQGYEYNKNNEKGKGSTTIPATPSTKTTASSTAKKKSGSDNSNK